MSDFAASNRGIERCGAKTSVATTVSPTATKRNPCHDADVAEFVYIDETGSVGRGARNQPLLTVVAVVVDEAAVQPLAERMQQITMKHFGWIPAGFEVHANELWNARGHWAGLTAPQLLATFQEIVGLLDELLISVVHASIDKASLNTRYNGAYDGNAYLLALQFMLEKLDLWRPAQPLRVIIADEAKEQKLKAIRMVREMQTWAVGAIPGRKLVTVIDSMHFVDSRDSPGVQLADVVAFLIHRAELSTQGHPDADTAVASMRHLIAQRTPTWRAPWPS